MNVTILFNEPQLPPSHVDFASEAGVLESVGAVGCALRAAGHSAATLGLRDQIDDLVRHVKTARPEVIVNLCESFAGRSAHEPHIAGLLEVLHIPYTGSPPECLALVHDKPRAKALLRGMGIPTADFVVARRGEPLPNVPLQRLLAGGPLFVKPAAEDASLGINSDSVVGNWPSLERRISQVQQQYGDALIEPFLNGREFNIGVVAVPDPIVLPLAEIEFHRDAAHPQPIATYDSKWDSGSRADMATPVRCPADVDPQLAERLRRVALDTFRATGCRDYARIDVRLSGAGDVFVLEVNANPDIGPAAGLARALRSAGWTYEEFIRCLVRTGYHRGAPSP